MADLNSTIVRGDLRVTGDIKGTAINTRAKVFSISRDVEEDIPLAELDGIKTGDIIYYEQYDECGIATVSSSQLYVNIPNYGFYWYNITQIDYEFDHMIDTVPTRLYKHHITISRSDGAPYIFDIITTSSTPILGSSPQIAIETATFISARATNSGSTIDPWLQRSRTTDRDYFSVFHVTPQSGGVLTCSALQNPTQLTDVVTRI